MEIHVTLNTNTKLFCGCTAKGEEPNSSTCEVCLGHPGAKPTVNKEAIKKAVRVCKALNTKVRDKVIFSRKNYYYPDLSKNYQITQYEEPLGEEGFLIINNEKIGIKRIHIEEDPAAITREEKGILIDYNRSGTPLVEIVTDPDLKTSEEARLFMKKLLRTLKYLGVYDKGSVLKADVNVSTSKNNYTRTEVKNVTGFKEIQRCIEYEVKNQGDESKEQTKSWDAAKGVTILMREKESEADYGYIYEPDIAPINVPKKILDEELPELAEGKIESYKDLGVKEEDSEIIAEEPLLARFFEETIQKSDPRATSKFFRSMLLGILNYNNISIEEYNAKPEDISELVNMLEKGLINEKTAKKILIELLEKELKPSKYVEENGLKLLTDKKAIKKMVEEAFKENPLAVKEYKQGNDKSLNYLVGVVMKKTKGKADPGLVSKIVKENI